MRYIGAWLIFVFLFFAPLLGSYPTLQTARLVSIPDLSDYPKVYQRRDQLIDLNEEAVEVILVGDILCGRDGESQGLNLEQASSWLRSADLTIGNLECVISSQNAFQRQVRENLERGPYRLIASPPMAGLLRQAGFDILGLANNHAFDQQATGLSDTLRYLRQNSIRTIGISRGSGCEIQPMLSQYGNIKIAFLAFNAIPWIEAQVQPNSQDLWKVNSWDESGCLLSAIQAASSQSEVVIVLAHWGREYENRASFSQEVIAKQLIDAGATLIVGYHPHVPQAITVIPGKGGDQEGVVAYSLGNFMADQQFGETIHGLALRVLVDTRGLRSVQALPVQAGPQPRLLDLTQANRWLAKLLPEPKPLVFTCDADSCSTEEMVFDNSPDSSGFFWSGEIDLTGDGFPEQIQLLSGQVVVYQGGIEAWRSPQNWRVVDLALGDPDHDGRYEMMLAFWREDQSGVIRSHPFIVGYRGGRYQETWGGSGVSDPILEVELGEVDGDGLEELVVLEQRRSGKQAVTVWDWHGWGFSLKWRSEEGYYQNLNLVHNSSETKEMICVFKDLP